MPRSRPQPESDFDVPARAPRWAIEHGVVADPAGQQLVPYWTEQLGADVTAELMTGVRRGAADVVNDRAGTRLQHVHRLKFDWYVQQRLARQSEFGRRS